MIHIIIYIGCLFFHRLIKDHCRLHNQALFPWFLPSFVIYPRSLTQPAPDAPALQRHKMEALGRKDERDAFMEAWQKSKDSGQGQVWIAKATTGAKGDLIFPYKFYDKFCRHEI